MTDPSAADSGGARALGSWWWGYSGRWACAGPSSGTHPAGCGERRPPSAGELGPHCRGLPSPRPVRTHLLTPWSMRLSSPGIPAIPPGARAHRTSLQTSLVSHGSAPRLRLGHKRLRAPPQAAPRSLRGQARPGTGEGGPALPEPTGQRGMGPVPPLGSLPLSSRLLPFSCRLLISCRFLPPPAASLPPSVIGPGRGRLYRPACFEFLSGVLQFCFLYLCWG